MWLSAALLLLFCCCSSVIVDQGLLLSISPWWDDEPYGYSCRYLFWLPTWSSSSYTCRRLLLISSSANSLVGNYPPKNILSMWRNVMEFHGDRRRSVVLLLVRHWWWRPFISAAEGVDLLRPRTVSHGNLLHDCPWGSLISTVLRFDSPRPVRPLLLLWLRSVLLNGPHPHHHTTMFSRFTTEARQDRSEASWGMDRVISALNYRDQDCDGYYWGRYNRFRSVLLCCCCC